LGDNKVTRPVTAEALHQEASILIRQTRYDEARILLLEALRLQPDVAELHASLANVFVYQHRYDEAIDEYRHALRLNPKLFAAHYILAIALHDKGRLAEAEAHFRQAIQLNLNHAEARHSLGITLMAQGRLEEAVAFFRQALRLNPNLADAYNNLANALGQQNHNQEAIDCYRQALRLTPNRAEVHFNLALTLERQNSLDEAIQSYREAIHLNPSYAEAYTNLGNALAHHGHPEKAIECYGHAVRIKPNYAEAYTNMGNVYRDQGRFSEAMTCYEQAMKQDAELAGPHHNRALLWLLLGDWVRGWPEYEWRWQTTDFPRYSFRQPRWDGSPLAGQTLLVLAEQGLGDTLQFIRFVPSADECDGKVVVMCQPQLLRLLAQCWAKVQVADQGSHPVDFDRYVPLMSLPGLQHTLPTRVPANIPYLHADAALVEHWKSANLRDKVQCETRIANPALFTIPHSPLRPPHVFVGIAWQGNPANRSDKQRSIPLRHFARLAEVPGAQLVSLQKGPGTEQLPKKGSVRGADCEVKDSLDSALRKPVIDDATGPFMDTAALMRQLDLVISSDTAVAHLAGALGIPAWIALPRVPDWRWLLQRDDSPWYPTLRLFRQTRPGMWDDVFDRIAEELEKVVRSVRAAQPVGLECPSTVS
jgi:tetratricopeptide (TPR) repeat protein